MLVLYALKTRVDQTHDLPAMLLLPICTGDQHNRETCLFDPGCSDQLVSFHGNHSFQGNASSVKNTDVFSTCSPDLIWSHL